MSTKATKRKSQALDNDASPVKTPRTQALPQPTTGSETEPKAAAKPDVEVSHPNSDDDNESNAEDESHTRHPGPFQKIQVLERSKDDLMLLLDNFSDKQVERYEAYRRSALNKAVIKRLVSTVLNQTVSSDLVFV
ncbi:transcription initiation factor TFIID subunit 11, partial [Dimargaris xerosporica]